MDLRRYENMTKLKGIETNKISQDIDNLFFSKPKEIETYLSYDIHNIAQSIADFTEFAVEVEVVQRFTIQPTTKEIDKETLTEVKN
jgi:hypothetical protein